MKTNFFPKVFSIKKVLINFIFHLFIFLLLIVLVIAVSVRYDEMLIYGESYFEPSFAEKWKLI